MLLNKSAMVMCGCITMKAYVQVSLDSAREKEVLEKLQSLPEVIDVHILFGEWDMIAKIDLPNPEELGSFVIDKIRSLPGVKLTSTMVIAK
ncbi:Lrp/AsnC family transcriptional regulator [Candidatus Woesearchaeota archaeon]|nr:Lrp/AsnC family transcriptional regulator [Candidatus Woesearchaeota archaeon]